MQGIQMKDESGKVETKPFGAKEFRAELEKLLPGFSWIVHRQFKSIPELLKATGTKSSGFNRLSTLSVQRRDRDEGVTYEAKSAGFGTRAQWLHTTRDGTLARAIRGLQDYYEWHANNYRAHAEHIKSARAASALGYELVKKPEGE